MTFSMQTFQPVSQSSKGAPSPQPMEEEVPGASMSPGSSQCSPLSGADLMATNCAVPKPTEGMMVPNPVTSSWESNVDPQNMIQAAPSGIQGTQETSSTDSLQGQPGDAEETGPNRRLKRLERNRESARLSRRRRKHYLEVLEEKVTKLANDVDAGRRLHVSQMVMVIQNMRSNLIQSGNELNIPKLEIALGRANQEAAVANTFRWQQLNSLCLPPSTKFIMWLTLQNDVYFRGGRAASERLSAARIGERMLQSGTNRVTPQHSMWPLLCNEVGLSYDQEEKVRAFQRTLLTTQPSWLNRHVAYGSLKTMESVHDAVQAVSSKLAIRESGTASILTPQQRMKFLGWAQRNRQRVNDAPKVNPPPPGKFATSPSQHLAANLYVLNHRLQTILDKIPRAPATVSPRIMKKLSRRPLFESLGCAEERSKGLSHEGSFASSNSLKRSASEMSIDGENPGQQNTQTPNICPEQAQQAAKPLVNQVLGHVAEIIPPPPISVPAPTPVVSMVAMAPEPQPMALPSAMIQAAPAEPPMTTSSNMELNVAPASMQTVASMPNMTTEGSATLPAHNRASSFLPLNVVPEELWPGDTDVVADEFLMTLVDGDWAIGEGVEF